MDLEQLRQWALADLKKISDPESLEIWRIKYLGRKSQLSHFLRSLADLSLEEKRQAGTKANVLKKELERVFADKKSKLKIGNRKLGIDLTAPGRKIPRGHPHPLTIVETRIIEIFQSLNFSVVEGPELETEYYNFDALNIPKDHPARDLWDTLWIDRQKGLLMRTHTSPVQIRYMEKHQPGSPSGGPASPSLGGPPFQIIVPGRVFRYEATDASHEINFHQVEGLMVGRNVSLANFKYIVEEFFKQFFSASGGKSIAFRFRPSYFPFVEPGLEVDIKMPGSERWLEMMGAGLVHPKVFEAVKYNPREWQGFAFGLGIERLAMIKYKIPDIRLFYSSDLRFIKQF